MTPEQIVEMIGNVANRADLKAIQASQVMFIKALVREARAEGMEATAKIADKAERDHLDHGDPTQAAACGQVAAMIREATGTVCSHNWAEYRALQGQFPTQVKCMRCGAVAFFKEAPDPEHWAPLRLYTGTDSVLATYDEKDVGVK